MGSNIFFTNKQKVGVPNTGGFAAGAGAGIGAAGVVLVGIPGRLAASAGCNPVWLFICPVAYASHQSVPYMVYDVWHASLKIYFTRKKRVRQESFRNRI